MTGPARTRFTGETGYERCDAALRNLGALPTPDAVAAYLADWGARGEPKQPESCPVAVWLRTMADAPSAYVCGLHVHKGGWITGRYIELPETVRQFVAAFDRGQYQQLRADLEPAL